MRNLLILFSLILLNLLALGQKAVIKLETRVNPDKSVDIYYDKTEPGSYTVFIKFKKLDNAHSADYVGVVKSSIGKLYSLQPINKDAGIGLSYSYNYFRGELNPKIDSTFTYLLPFEKGKSAYVDESGYLGKTFFGNELPKNWKSYQFTSFDTDSIFTSRKGLVVNVIDEYEYDSISYYTSKKNEVLVEHSDGSLTWYLGFSKNGIFVKKGQMVYPQTPLGVLGNREGKQINKLFFSVYFLVDADTKTNETLKNKRSRYQYITPFFYTQEGLLKITPRTYFTADYTEAILTKEFTKKELKERNSTSKK